MSSTSTPAFIHRGSWDDETRSHPAMKWMEHFTKAFDSGDISPKWYTADNSLQKADGSEYKGRDAAIAATKELFAPFTTHLHEPYFLYVSETKDGWEMLGQAKLFANLPGAPAPGEKKERDAAGKEWDIGVPAAFHIWYVKDAKAENGLGLAIKRTEIMSDSGVPMKVMLGRGLIKASDLGL